MFFKELDLFFSLSLSFLYECLVNVVVVVVVAVAVYRKKLLLICGEIKIVI